MRLLSLRVRKRLSCNSPLSAVPLFFSTFCIKTRDLRLFGENFWSEDAAAEGAVGTPAEASMTLCVLFPLSKS